jgi:hypothetical protein
VRDVVCRPFQATSFFPASPRPPSSALPGLQRRAVQLNHVASRIQEHLPEALGNPRLSPPSWLLSTGSSAMTAAVGASSATQLLPPKKDKPYNGDRAEQGDLYGEGGGQRRLLGDAGSP